MTPLNFCAWDAPILAVPRYVIGYIQCLILILYTVQSYDDDDDDDVDDDNDDNNDDDINRISTSLI